MDGGWKAFPRVRNHIVTCSRTIAMAPLPMSLQKPDWLTPDGDKGFASATTITTATTIFSSPISEKMFYTEIMEMALSPTSPKKRASGATANGGAQGALLWTTIATGTSTFLSPTTSTWTGPPRPCRNPDRASTKGLWWRAGRPAWPGAKTSCITTTEMELSPTFLKPPASPRQTARTVLASWLRISTMTGGLTFMWLTTPQQAPCITT